MAEHANLESLFSDIADELRKKRCRGDGIKFINVDDAMPHWDYFSEMCFGNNRYVGISTNPNSSQYPISYSNDGITWTHIYTSDAPAGSWKHICYGNGRFVIIGTDESNNTISAISYDGENWIDGGECGVNLSSVCYGNGKFVMIEAYSEDGISWTKTTGGEGFLQEAVTEGTYWKTDICYANDRFVAIRSEYVPIDDLEWDWEVEARYDSWESTFLYSDDGVTWKSGKLPVGAITTGRVLYANGTFISFAQQGPAMIDTSYGRTGIHIFLTSADGENWEALQYGELSSNTSQILISLEDIYHTNEAFIIKGCKFVDKDTLDGFYYVKVAYSLDLKSWVEEPSELEGFEWDVSPYYDDLRDLDNFEFFTCGDKLFARYEYDLYICDAAFVADKFNEKIASMFGRIISNDTDIVPTGQYATDTNYSESYGVKIGYCPNGDIMVSMMKVSYDNGPLHFSVVREGTFDEILEYTTSFQGQEGIYTCVISGITKLSEMSVSMDETETLNTGETAIKCLITITALEEV